MADEEKNLRCTLCKKSYNYHLKHKPKHAFNVYA